MFVLTGMGALLFGLGLTSLFGGARAFWEKIPGASPKECGNCLEHNLPQAKAEAKEFLNVIKDWTKEDLVYPTAEDDE